MKRSYAALLLVFSLSAAAWGQGAPALPSAPVANTPAAQAQAPAPGGATTTLQARSNLVILDVVVTDKNHNPIRDLKAADFVVKDKGAPQTIKSLEEHYPATVTAGPAMPPMPAGVFTNYMQVPENGPVNILLIDRLNTPIESQSFLHDQLVKFLKTLTPGTKLAIFGLNTQLVYLQGFTSEPQLLLKALEAKKGLPRSSPLIEGPDDSALSDMMADSGTPPDVIANVQQFEAQNASFRKQLQVRYTLEAMNALARYLSSIPGRKNLIWFSGSFPITILPDGDLQNPFAVVADMEDEFRDTANLLSKAQVAVYPIDARGLQTSGLMDASQSGSKFARNPAAFGKANSAAMQKIAEEQMTMRQMAEETGGEAFVNTNGLAEAVGKAIANGSSYYTLTYSPTDTKFDGSFRKIQVSANRPGVTLEYRRGYYTEDAARSARKPLPVTPVAGATATPSPAPPTPERLALRNAMIRGVPNPTQIVFKVFVSPLGPPTEMTVAEKNIPAPTTKGPFRRYTVNYAVAPRDLSYKTLGGGRYEISVEFMVFVYDANGVLINSMGNTVRANMAVADIKEAMKAGLQFAQSVSVPAKGEYFLRIGVHDLQADHIGAVEVPVDAVKNLAVVVPPTPEPPKPKLSDLPK